MSINEKIKATATENTRLLKLISETDYAPAALRQSNDFIANLKKDILAQEKLLEETKRTIAREEAEHKEYQTSHMKRLAYRLGGKREKFEQKASKEEKDWVEAVQRGFECQKKLDTLNFSLAEATKTKTEMEKVAAIHQQAQLDLDQLYKSIFEGPTPDIPGEDARESAVYQASANFDNVQSEVDKEKRVKFLLGEVDKFLTKAAQDVEGARSNARMDAWGIDNVFMDMAEANALSRVRQNVSQADMLISQARQLQPAVGNLGNIVHAQHDFMRDVLFDNVFSDMAKYDAIKQSQASIVKAREMLNGEVRRSNERLQVVAKEASTAKQVVDERRLELQQIRAEAYQRIAGSGVAIPDGPPPTYQA